MVITTIAKKTGIVMAGMPVATIGRLATAGTATTAVQAIISQQLPKLVILVRKIGLAAIGHPALITGNTETAGIEIIAEQLTANRLNRRPALLALKIGLAAIGANVPAPVHPAGNCEPVGTIITAEHT